MKKVKLTMHEGRPVRVEFRCPGCGRMHSLPLRGPESHSGWEFSGSAENPTLSPSILARTGPFPEDHDPGHIILQRGIVDELNAERCLVCHSFVRNGRIEFLGDCTHRLKGQTVPLPEIDYGENRDTTDRQAGEGNQGKGGSAAEGNA